MEKETIKKIFEFLEENGEHNAPLMWKLQNNIPITEKDDLIVKGNLDLSHSKITSLPEGLKVEGKLVLSYSNITSLPEGLKVGGSIVLSYSKINSLPKGLEVGYDLYIDNTALTKYTNAQLRKMIKPGVIKARIYR
jgi:hypothetical protein